MFSKHIFMFFRFLLSFVARIFSQCFMLNLVSHKGEEDDTARRRGARVSDIFVTIARCRVPDYPAPRGELFLRRDSTQAALSRLSCLGKENIKLVPAAFTMPARAARCYARQSLLHAFFLITLDSTDDELTCVSYRSNPKLQDAKAAPSHTAALLPTAETLHLICSEL